MKSSRALETIMPWAVTIGIFIVWELGCLAFNVPAFILPRPTVFLDVLWRLHEAILHHAFQTLLTTVIGFALAVGFGIVAGIMIGASPLVYDSAYPLLIGFNSIPKVAVVPVLVIWFGIGAVPAVLTAFMISVFPIIVNVATGIATVEPELRDVLRALGAKPYQILLKVGLPRSLPLLFASLKIAITLAFIGSVISETVASNEGIGYLMVAASSRFEVPLVFAGLIVIAVMGVAMYAVFAVIEMRLTRWAFRSSPGA
ncbi:MAG: ABC transporter permease [Proteobacteria bacterium]|nr:ABC transporter permease [Pseudomonadota bacterium]